MHQLNETIIIYILTCTHVSRQPFTELNPFSILCLRKISQQAGSARQHFFRKCSVKLNYRYMSSYIETTGAYGPIQMSSVQEQPSSKIRVCKIFKASYISSCWSYNICAINPSNIQDFFCTFLALKPISMTGLWQGKGSAVLLKTFEHPRKGLQIKVFRHEELFLCVVFILISSKSVDNFLVLWHLWKLQFLLFLLLLIQAAVLRLLWVKEETSQECETALTSQY